MSVPENPTAFPAAADGFGNFLKGTPGMTLRDWFAGQALAANADNHPDEWDHAEVARDCYAYASAMLAAREQGK